MYTSSIKKWTTKYNSILVRLNIEIRDRGVLIVYVIVNGVGGYEVLPGVTN